MSAPTRPVLRYHGGKWLLAPWIIQHFPPHDIYVEPFAGGASVLLRKAPARAEVYNDLDEEAWNFFSVLRDPDLSERLRTNLELTPYSRIEFWNAYEPATDPVERARRLVVRSYMGFGTTTRRKNRTGFRATPWRGGGSTAIADWTRYPDSLCVVRDRLRGVALECRPAVEVIRQQDSPVTLFYVDPPYPISTRTAVQWPSRNDRAYAHELTDDDHRDLAEVLHAAEGMVVLSGYACDLYDIELYPDWHRVTRKALADGARERTEVLWLNPAASAQLAPTLFSAGVA